MVGDYDSLALLFREDEILYLLHVLRGDVGEWLVQKAEFGGRPEHKVYFREPGLSSGELMEALPLFIQETYVKRHQTVVVDMVQVKRFLQRHPRRHEQALGKILYPFADTVVVGIHLIVESHEQVLGLDPAHYAPEQTGLSDPVPSEEAGNLAGLGSYERTPEDDLLTEFEMHAVNQHLIYPI